MRTVTVRHRAAPQMLRHLSVPDSTHAIGDLPAGTRQVPDDERRQHRPLTPALRKGGGAIPVADTSRTLKKLSVEESWFCRYLARKRADKEVMTPATELSAPALATELAYLLDLPVEQRGPAQGARYDEVRWALADIDPADRMTAYAAAVAAVDPAHVLGPYPDFAATELTIELYAFEEWRLERVYSSEQPESNRAATLLCVTEMLFHTWEPEETFKRAEVIGLLRFRRIGSEDFPGFSLDDFHRTSGVDLAARQALVTSYAAAARALIDEASPQQ